MNSFQSPHKAFETVHCRKIPTPMDCLLLSFYVSRLNTPTTSFEIRESSKEGAGRGLFSKVDISKGSLIGFEMGPLSLHIHPSAMSTIEAIFDFFPETSDINAVYGYMFGYGYSIYFFVSISLS